MCMGNMFATIITLFSGKEKELLAMKMGGNKLINEVFEMDLTEAQKSVLRPTPHTDLDARSKYIYDKYQHRKWYDGEGYKKLKLREKADSALSNLNSHKKHAAVEADFFTERANRSSDCLNDEDDWWNTNSSSIGGQNDGNKSQCGGFRTSGGDNKDSPTAPEDLRESRGGRSNIKIRRIQLRTKGSSSSGDDDSHDGGADSRASVSSNGGRLIRKKVPQRCDGQPASGGSDSKSNFNKSNSSECEVDDPANSTVGRGRTPRASSTTRGARPRSVEGGKGPSGVRARSRSGSVVRRSRGGARKPQTTSTSSNSPHEPTDLESEDGGESTTTGVSSGDYDDEERVCRSGRRRRPAPNKGSTSPTRGEDDSVIKGNSSVSTRRPTRSSSKDDPTRIRRERTRSTDRKPRPSGTARSTNKSRSPNRIRRSCSPTRSRLKGSMDGSARLNVNQLYAES